MAFRVPADSEARETRYWQDETGQKWRSFGNICWFTNLDIPKRHEALDLWQHYSQKTNPGYDNYDAIEVSKVSDIPVDYFLTMCVPVTFLEKYNPDQFEIVGITKTWFGAANKKYGDQIQVDKNGTKSRVSKLNDGAVLKMPRPPTGKTFYIVGDESFIQTFPRILIRRRK